MCNPNNPIFHVELVTSKNKMLDNQEFQLKQNNFNKYNGERISLLSKSNWNCVGRAFSLIIDDNGIGTPLQQKKEVHITLGFFPNGCDVNQCHMIVEKIINQKLV